MFFLFLIPRAHADSRHFFIIMAVSMAVAAFFYLTMSTGSPAALIEGRIFYWGRYIDWMITTPLFLLDLALLALARWQRISNQGNQADRAGCVHYPSGPQVGASLTGFGKGFRFIVSTAAMFVLLLPDLHGAVRADGESRRVAAGPSRAPSAPWHSWPLSCGRCIQSCGC